ncbi:hypothetical protein I302_105706 [Kwoniella bestiolae CBS 10118]|uniref:Uncharacterized protein n=1 Tax=Kwoniella bestiolae CBS 10118 TaxID=1296100 RepID=A0A1B9G1W5_9TREE|nr:hypothetical protein I302_04826 [Kwoniella bestiolae CBS 10118]OCF25016.1 hypothetical protein I302_04826 [Kwoniella bestiolae CBS 10118]
MVYFSTALPPPAVFLHQETLHAIPLPPLASWLTSLSRPEHLVRLNDLLERYKTPQSYHRVDVRVVESSELPVGSPDSHAAEVDVDRGGREIVELEKGDTLERYWSSRIANDGANEQESGEGEQRTNGPDTIQINDDEEKEMDGPIAQPQAEAEQTDSNTPPISQTAQALKALQLPPLPSDLKLDSNLPPSPIPNHPLPPIGPKRKVRELRLDLRTLDAAALFALETWRREELGLEKLNMEFPDSVWYKDATPTPSPSPPPPRYTSTGRKFGGLRKVQTPIIVNNDDGDEGLHTGLGQDVGQVGDGEEAGDGIMSIEQKEGYENLVNTLQSNNQDEGDIETQQEIRTNIQIPDILENTGDLAHTDIEVVKENVEVSAMNQTSAQPQHQNPPVEFENPTVGSALIDRGPDDAPPQPQPQPEIQAEAEAGPSRTTPLSPSPDILLNDIFNEKEDDDSDFIPPPSPPARRPRPRKNRKSRSSIDKSADQDGVSVDPEISEIPISTPSASEMRNSRPRSPEVFMASSRKSKSVSIEVISPTKYDQALYPSQAGESIQILQSVHPALVGMNDRSPSIELLPDPPEPARSTKRSREPIPTSTRLPKKARISIDPPVTITPISGAKARARFVVEIPSRKVMEDSEEDEEDEEWGFLRSFG